MIEAEKKAITSLDAEIIQAWKFPQQTLLDL
jgi:hypothetical protein